MPCDHEKAGVWPFGGVWLSLHCWEHYQYTLDKNYLRDYGYPIMKEAMEFLLDFMFEDRDGHLQLGPSCSPENQYMQSDGQLGTICMNSTCDIVLTKLLIDRLQRSTQILGIDIAFAERLRVVLSKLPPYRIGYYGQLQEWAEDYREEDKGHRHTSHLLGLFPFYEKELTKNQKLREAAKLSLQTRFDEGAIPTGWTRAWHIGLWSRLNNAEMAYRELKDLLAHDTQNNLFDSHPAIAGSTNTVFQIDGNLGAVAGICNMLMQSHGSTITILPALPKEWKNGNIKGIMAKGAVKVDIQWDDGQLSEVALCARHSQTVTVRYRDTAKEIHLLREKKQQLIYCKENCLESI